MHRSLRVAIPAAETDLLVEELRAFGEQVISISVQRGASVKPPGDVVTVHVLNRATSRVLAVVGGHRGAGEVSVATSQVDSIDDPSHASALEGDLDEAPWGDVGAQLREHARISPNYIALMAIGGAIAACGLVATSTTQVVAIITAAIIAPAFEPLAAIPLGIVVRRRRVVFRAVLSTLVGFAVLIAAGAVTMLLLDAAGSDMSERFLENHHVHELAGPSTVNVAVSVGGALAGAIIITAYRLPLLPGPIAALHLVEAAAMTGMALVLGEGELARQAFERLGADIALVLAACLVVFGLKHLLLHGRPGLSAERSGEHD